MKMKFQAVSGHLAIGSLVHDLEREHKCCYEIEAGVFCGVEYVGTPRSKHCPEHRKAARAAWERRRVGKRRRAQQALKKQARSPSGLEVQQIN